MGLDERSWGCIDPKIRPARFMSTNSKSECEDPSGKGGHGLLAAGACVATPGQCVEGVATLDPGRGEYQGG